MTTPVLPEVADLDTFGGSFEDADAVVDPQTELSAAYFNRLVAQVAMLSHTAPRAWARCTVSGGVITLADHDAVWGAGAGVAPTPNRSGAGVYTVTWAASYDDLQATPESHNVSFRAAKASGDGAAARIVQGSLSSANVASVKSFDAAGAPVDVTEFVVMVW